MSCSTSGDVWFSRCGAGRDRRCSCWPGYGQHAWARGNRLEMHVHLTGRQLVASKESNVARGEDHEVVCAPAMHRHISRKTGYEADCSIMSGTRKLHGPASRWALALLPCAAMRSAGRQLTQIREESSQLLGALIAVCFSTCRCTIANPPQP